MLCSIYSDGPLQPGPARGPKPSDLLSVRPPFDGEGPRLCKTTRYTDNLRKLSQLEHPLKVAKRGTVVTK
eukprot:7916606-Pyramimonas_sp.AAC.1